MQGSIQLVSVPAIAAIVYWTVWLIRYACKDSEKFKRLIPLVSALLGAMFGLAAYYLVPTIIPAENVVTAVMVGGASGLSATGAHQIVKQLMKKCSPLPVPAFEENGEAPSDEEVSDPAPPAHPDPPNET